MVILLMGRGRSLVHSYGQQVVHTMVLHGFLAIAPNFPPYRLNVAQARSPASNSDSGAPTQIGGKMLRSRRATRTAKRL